MLSALEKLIIFKRHLFNNTLVETKAKEAIFSLKSLTS